MRTPFKITSFRVVAVTVVAGCLFLFGSPVGRQAVRAQADIFSAFLTQFQNRFPNVGAYPPGASVVQASSGNVAAATGTATLPAAAGKTTWIFGFDVYGSGATAASVISCTVTNLISATATYTLVVPAGVTTTITPLSIRFPEPIQANAVNTTIPVSCPSFGAGNTNATVNAYGFQTAATGP